MARFRIKPASLDKLKANFQAATDKKVAQLTLALGNWGLDVVSEIGQELIRVNAIDQGILQAATTLTPVTREGSKLKVTIFNPIEYAPIVEHGRLPGGSPPPLLPLVGWAVRKGIVSHLPVNPSFEEYRKELAASAAILKHMGHGGGGKGRKQEMDPVVLDFLKVRLIARKIAEEGVAGRHPFANAWDRKSRTFVKDVASMVESMR